MDDNPDVEGDNDEKKDDKTTTPHTSRRDSSCGINLTLTTADSRALFILSQMSSFFVTKYNSSCQKTSVVSELADRLRQVRVAKLERKQICNIKIEKTKHQEDKKRAEVKRLENAEIEETKCLEI